jgi:hypothetical protein
MLRTSLVCVLALGGCVNDAPPEYVPEEPGPPSQMIRTRTMAGELPVVGIDSDRAGGLWIAYSKAMGGYYAPDDVRLVHVDKHGAKTAEFRFSDTYADILGIAFDGHAVWINVTGATGTDGPYVRAIDAVTGLEVARHVVESGISDLEVDDARGELLLSSVYDRVIALDLATGVETREPLGSTHSNFPGVQAAIAITGDGSMWYASRYWNYLELRNPQGIPVATYTENVTDDHHVTDYRLFLAWDPTTKQVIASAENQISWLSIRGGTP